MGCKAVAEGQAVISAAPGAAVGLPCNERKYRVWKVGKALLAESRAVSRQETRRERSVKVGFTRNENLESCGETTLLHPLYTQKFCRKVDVPDALLKLSTLSSPLQGFHAFVTTLVFSVYFRLFELGNDFEFSANCANFT